jgi:hypothetical protein
MATSWDDQKVVCPLYKGENRKRRWIICEGHGYAVKNISEYRRERDMQKQLDVFCRCRYSYCEHYRAIVEEKYEDEK